VSRLSTRHAQNGVPAALYLKNLNGRLAARRRAQVREVALQAGRYLPAHALARGQQARERVLYGRSYRKIGVGNQLEPLGRLGTQNRRPADHDPSELHLRHPDDLR